MTTTLCRSPTCLVDVGCYEWDDVRAARAGRECLWDPNPWYVVISIGLDAHWTLRQHFNDINHKIVLESIFVLIRCVYLVKPKVRCVCIHCCQSVYCLTPCSQVPIIYLRNCIGHDGVIRISFSFKNWEFSLICCYAKAVLNVNSMIVTTFSSLFMFFRNDVNVSICYHRNSFRFLCLYPALCVCVIYTVCPTPVQW